MLHHFRLLHPLGHIDAAAANQRAPAGAGAEFCQGHPNRHTAPLDHRLRRPRNAPAPCGAGMRPCRKGQNKGLIASSIEGINPVCAAFFTRSRCEIWLTSRLGTPGADARSRRRAAVTATGSFRDQVRACNGCAGCSFGPLLLIVRVQLRLISSRLRGITRSKDAVTRLFKCPTLSIAPPGRSRSSGGSGPSGDRCGVWGWRLFWIRSTNRVK